MRMKEIMRSFPDIEGALFQISLCGISFCDGTYYVNRKNSKIYCMEFIQKGGGTVHTPSGVLHPKQGDVYLLHKGDNHLYYSDKKHPWQKIWFNISGPLVSSLIETYGLSRVYHISNCDVNEHFIQFKKIAFSELTQEEILRDCALVFHKIVAALSQSLHERGADEKNSAQLLKQYIDHNYEKSISIADLAQLIYRSPSQTIRTFKKEFGTTPYEYTLLRKIQVAKQLLSDSGVSICEISEQLGFKDEHYFSALFKKRVGISPGKYRR